MNFRTPLARTASMLVLTAAINAMTQSSFAMQTMPSKAPSTMPTSGPAVAVDTTTPRGALKMLLMATQNGDSAQLKKLIVAVTPTEERVVAMMSRQTEVRSKFRDAAVKAFGANNADTLTGKLVDGTGEGMAKVDASNESINGELATVDDGSGGPPMQLKKVDGEWKALASEFFRGVPPQMVDQQLDDLNYIAGLLEEFSADLGTGKFKTAEEARDGLKQYMTIEMMKRSSTRPSVPPPGNAPGDPMPAAPETPATPTAPDAPAPTTQPK